MNFKPKSSNENIFIFKTRKPGKLLGERVARKLKFTIELCDLEWCSTRMVQIPDRKFGKMKTIFSVTLWLLFFLVRSSNARRINIDKLQVLRNLLAEVF